jgi:hypothetical protein
MRSEDALTAEGSARVVRESLDHLCRLVLPEGKFIYAHQADEIGVRFEGYNILRHYGTLWFVLRAVNNMKSPLSEPVAKSATAAVDYAVSKLAHPNWVRGE